MSAKTCCIDGCSRDHEARGWCHIHYERWRRNGDVQSDVPIGGWTNPIDTCAVDGCGRKHEARGWCVAHYRRAQRTGDVSADNPVGRHKPDDPAYRTVHNRLTTQRGPASERDCVECLDQADHWAYDHSDPDESTSDEGWPYSTDLDRYDPRCQPCHVRFDREKAST